MAKPDPPSAAGPAVHLVGIFPQDGCGVGAAPTCTVATNATLTLRFDRFLNPATVNRQAISVYTGDPKVAGSIPFEVAYDPVERVVEYRMPAGYGFVPRSLYQLELTVPVDEGDYGIRAFDGAPLREADLPLHISFFTSDAPADLPVEAAPTCDDIVNQVFGQLGNCAGSECHQRGGNRLGDMDLLDAPHGLWLDKPADVQLSAVARVARQTELGDQSGGVPVESGPRFGVRMPLLDPQNPGGSYLLYKLLRNPANFEACLPDASAALCHEPADPCVSTHTALPLPAGECIVPPADELDRLREWFVRGEPMPRVSSLGAQGNVRLQGLRALSRFIAAGADCRK